ncbi:MAG: pyruvate dehydrogenase (acetyl-transferring) E1 component subunit alpha, partial [Asgard group archaeon]
DEKFEEEVQKELTELVDKAVKDAEAVPIPEPEEIFKYTYAEMPWNLEEQLEDLKEFLKEEE